MKPKNIKNLIGKFIAYHNECVLEVLDIEIIHRGSNTKIFQIKWTTRMIWGSSKLLTGQKNYCQIGDTSTFDTIYTKDDIDVDYCYDSLALALVNL